MKASELANTVGKVGVLRVSGTALLFEVKVCDARYRYGHLDYLVSPIAGGGETWHQSDQITFYDITTEGIEG